MQLKIGIEVCPEIRCYLFGVDKVQGRSGQIEFAIS